MPRSLPAVVDAFVPRARIRASRAANRLRDLGLPLPPAALVMYHEAYVTALDGGMRHTFDGRRPLRIVERLRHAGVISRRQLLKPEPASFDDLALIHPRHFLQQLEQPQLLARLFHLPVDTIHQLDQPLLPFLYQTGGTIEALSRAIRGRVPVFNLGGGFHHAQRDRAEGFCPVNDIAIAIEHVRRARLARRIVVIDLDFHHGNGTALIFADDEDVLTISIHGQAWARVDNKRNNIDVELPAGTTDEAYLRCLHRIVQPRALRAFRPDAAIYLAGADPFTRDPLGDFDISEDGMLDRDLYVWQLLRRLQIPFAVVLGGGYGPLAWGITYNFVCSVLTRTRLPPRYRPSDVGEHVQRVGRRLGPAQLRRGDTDIDEGEIAEIVQAPRRSRLFMGTYTLDGMELALEEYGFLGLLRERGFTKPLLSVDLDDPDRHIFRIHDGRRDPEHILLELVVRQRTLVPPPAAPSAPRDQLVLSVEWLAMQNPRACFTLDRPKLPGQRCPGLGVSNWVFALLRMMAERLGCAGLASSPAHYHNALLYAREMLFWDPTLQGRFEALRALLAHLSLPEAAWCVENGQVEDRSTGEAFKWQGEPQVYAMSPALKGFFDAPAYRRSSQRQREHDALHLRLRAEAR